MTKLGPTWCARTSLPPAAANRGNHAAAQIAKQALADLVSVRSERVAAWKKQLPALGTKLDLVLRDVALGEALDAFGEAAKLEIRLIEGSNRRRPGDAGRARRAGSRISISEAPRQPRRSTGSFSRSG